jgi:hypothetical protein
VFGFLLLVYVILGVTCAEITIVLDYFQLCAEDYRWWWRSLLTSGSTAVYVFLYSIAYFARLEGNMPVTYALYFGYMGLISLGIFLITGTIGFFSSLYFNYQVRACDCCCYCCCYCCYCCCCCCYCCYRYCYCYCRCRCTDTHTHTYTHTISYHTYFATSLATCLPPIRPIYPVVPFLYTHNHSSLSPSLLSSTLESFRGPDTDTIHVLI